MQNFFHLGLLLSWAEPAAIDDYMKKYPHKSLKFL